MKRIMGLMLLVAVLMVPTAGFAASDQLGIYVAPKFVYGLTQMNNVKHNYTENYPGGVDFESYSVGDKHDNTFGGSLAIGYDFDKMFEVPVRAEIEYSIFSRAKAKQRFTEADTGLPNERMSRTQSFNIQTLFVNAYWDINTGTKFTPYVGAGIGAAFIKTKGNSKGYNDLEGSWDIDFGSKTVTNFAWNVGAGLGYDITDHWTVDLGYRFVGLGSVKTGTYYEPSGAVPGTNDSVQMKSSDLRQHQVSLGVRYTF